MIVWKGWGVYVPIVTFVCLIAVQTIVNNMHNDKLFYSLNAWPKVLAFVLAGALVFLINKLLTKKQGARAKAHTFFFIPALYWTGILPVVGLVMALMK